MKKTLLVLFLILLIIPAVYATNLLDALKGGIESITGRSAVTVSISVGNNAPNISSISLNGQTWSPADGDLRAIEIDFLVDDPEGNTNLNNASAKANISLSGSNVAENTTCSSLDLAGNGVRYNCTVYAQYFWASSASWLVEAEIADNNNNYNQSSGTWTYSAGTYFNLSSSSLAWSSVVPLETNKTSTTTMTAENTGNQATLKIKTTIIDLGGPSVRYIPAENFTVFNSTTGDTECDSANQSATITYGAQPAVGVNNTQIDVLLNALAIGQGTNPESLYYCLFDVPANLQSETYGTSYGSSWDITAST